MSSTGKDLSISYIVPAYNAARHLDACIESILHCVRPGDRVIAVNDGSTDETGSRLDALASQHAGCITVIHKENGGLVSARNAGMEKARTPYVLFIDADDLISAEVLNRARDRGWPDDADIVEFDFAYIKGKDRWPARKSSTPPSTTLRGSPSVAAHLLERDQLYVWMRLFRTAFLRTLPDNGFISRRGFEDITAMVYIAAHVRCLHHAGGELITYRQHETNYTGEKTARKCIDLAMSLQPVRPVWRASVHDQKLLDAYNRLAVKIAYWSVKDWVGAKDRRSVSVGSLFETASNSALGDWHPALAQLAAGSRQDRKIARHVRAMQRSLQGYVLLRRAAAGWKRMRSRLATQPSDR